MTRLIFSYVHNLTRADSKPVPAGLLVLEDDKIVSFEWYLDPDKLDEPGLAQREIVATWPDYIRLLVDEEWPQLPDRYREDGLARYIAMCCRHGNIYVSRIEEDVQVPTWPPGPEGVM